MSKLEMPSATWALGDWLRYLEAAHPVTIEMGLARVHQVASRLGLLRIAPFVFVVAGTNGKGTATLALEAIAKASGYSVGATLSPHLFDFNERIRINGRMLDDQSIIAAFAAIDRARRKDLEISLTYFEVAMLAAFYCFRAAKVEVAVVEVGLGGRLDASNILDADVAIITSIDLDHQEYLGDTREAIGAEKAGVFRAGQKVVIGEPNSPQSLLHRAAQLNCQVWRAGVDFKVCVKANRLQYEFRGEQLKLTPVPSLIPENLATALTAWRVSDLARATPETMASVLAATVNTGRLQRMSATLRWGSLPLVVDVGHNPEGARLLARTLGEDPCTGKTHLVLAVLKEKDAAAIVSALAPQINCWYCAPTVGPRARSAEDLQQIVCAQTTTPSANQQVSAHADVARALRAAMTAAEPGDRLVVSGSFYAAAAALHEFGVSRVAEMTA